MRHQKKHGMKLGTDASHTKAMKKSLVRALLTNDRIKTTLTRAKAIRPEVDKVITWAKRGDLHARRLAIAAVGDAELIRETFEKAAQGMWQDRNGGYTRIIKLGPRKGDNAEIALIELVQEAVSGSKKTAKPAAKVSKVEKPAKAEKTEKDQKAEKGADAKPASEAKPAEKPAADNPPADKAAEKAEEKPAADKAAEKAEEKPAADKADEKAEEKPAADKADDKHDEEKN